MSVDVKLPLLADSMTAGRLGAWLKREGDTVSAGEPIVEVETDKTSVEIESPVSGVLERIAVKAGTDGVPVGTVLATIAEGGAGERPAPKAPAAPSAKAPAPPAATRAAAAASPPPMPEPALAATHAAAATVGGANTTDATPVARKMAQLAGLDLGTFRVEGGRKITKADVELALGRRPATAGGTVQTPAAAPDVSAIRSEFEDRPLSAMRRVTAARLQQAKQTVPHFYLQTDCRVDALLDMRLQWNSRRGAAKISLTDLLVFATSRALQKVPQANAAFTGNAVRVFHSADIAVAVNTPAGLVTPIVRGAHKKSVLAISAELAELAGRARTGSLAPPEYSGGTFTISNLGMYGVTAILPILNPPNACIMGIGAVEARPVVNGTAVVAGRMMSVTLAADHRAIDGATGAELLAEVRRLVEDPLALTLEA